MDLLKYIRSHDDYRQHVDEAGGNEMTVSINRNYEKQRRYPLRRQANRRIDNLFAMIENENPEYRKLSFC